MTYVDICNLHNVMHCIDCGYLWFTVDDAGVFEPVAGTGAWWGIQHD